MQHQNEESRGQGKSAPIVAKNRRCGQRVEQKVRVIVREQLQRLRPQEEQ